MLNAKNFTFNKNDEIDKNELFDLYSSNDWSSAEKTDKLLHALKQSHLLVTARKEGRLVALGNSLSDGYLVVYFPHLIVHRDFQRQGLGSRVMSILLDEYRDFHQKVLVADEKSVDFYIKHGFIKAGKTQAMWIYSGNEH